MKLQLLTWQEVENYLKRSPGIFVPAGSTEQHGPNGLIGTDTLCAEDVGGKAAEIAGALVAPALAYTPAPFNMAFPGTVSVSAHTFHALASEVIFSLAQSGFARIYVLNAHGANLEPLNAVKVSGAQVRIKSWWEFDPVNAVRDELFGEWEGMHATPSEISMTQVGHRTVDVPPPPRPDRPLSREFIKSHAGDRHGPPDQHRAEFPDGRVGSDSALASPENGKRLLEAAAKAVAEDYLDFVAA